MDLCVHQNEWFIVPIFQTLKITILLGSTESLLVNLIIFSFWATLIEKKINRTVVFSFDRPFFIRERDRSYSQTRENLCLRMEKVDCERKINEITYIKRSLNHLRRVLLGKKDRSTQRNQTLQTIFYSSLTSNKKRSIKNQSIVLSQGSWYRRHRRSWKSRDKQPYKSRSSTTGKGGVIRQNERSFNFSLISQ